jgi:hypothetical protein
VTAVTAVLGGESRMLIDGKLTGGAGGRMLDNVNPATEEVIGQCADASAVDMDAAIAAARRALGRQGGVEGLEQYLQTNSVAYANTRSSEDVSRIRLLSRIGSSPV